MNLPFDLDWRVLGLVLLIAYVTSRLHTGMHALQILGRAGARIGRARTGAQFRATADRARVGKAHLERKLVVTFYEDGVGLGTTDGVDEAFLPFEDLVQTDSFTFPLLYRGPHHEVGINLGLRVQLPPQIRKETAAPSAT